MKKIIPILSAILLFSCTQNTAPKEESKKKETKESKEAIETKSDSIVYDSLRAQKLGADDYGMKKYVMALLKTGPNRPTDSTERANLMKGHLDNIGRMADAGQLVLAGPFFFRDGDLRGIYIFDVQTIEEAEALTNTDPAIQAGSLIMELHEWYGSAALMEVNEIHKEIAKIYI